MIKNYLIIALLLAVGTALAGVAVRSTNSYYFGTTAVSFSQAWAYCKNADLQFVSLPTAAQNDALVQGLKEIGAPIASFWVGGLYMRNGFIQKWYWVDGRENFNYYNWERSPTLSFLADNCLLFSYNPLKNTGTWKPANCSAHNYFICQ